MNEDTTNMGVTTYDAVKYAMTLASGFSTISLKEPEDSSKTTTEKGRGRSATAQGAVMAALEKRVKAERASIFILLVS